MPKKIVWIKEKLGDKLDETTVEFEGAIDVLKESDTLLRVFQHQQPTIHVIKASILELAKNCFLNITAPNNLLHSDGTPLGGKSLQNLHFETEEAKTERKAKDKDTEKQIQELTEEERKLKASIKSNNFFEKSSAEQKLSKVAQRKRKCEEEMSSGKFAKLFKMEEITLSKEMKETILRVTKDNEEKKSKSQGVGGNGKAAEVEVLSYSFS